MRIFLHSAVIVVLFAVLGNAASDPIAQEIDRWMQYLETNKATSEEWKSVQESSKPFLDKATQALKDGRRNAAVHYLAAVRSNLAGAKFVQDHKITPETKLESLEQEWKKEDSILHAPKQPSWEGTPAAIRAIGEATFSEIKVYYDASLEYGRNTTPEYGYFYLGLSKAQLDFTDVLSKVERDGLGAAPDFPGLLNQIDRLEDELLAAYKPPASIDQHPTFIRASAMIKQARELYAANLKHGAIYRLLQAQQAMAKVTDPGISVPPEQFNSKMQEANQRLSGNQDHSIARIFVERAAVEPEDAETAAAIFQKVLPLYFEAMKSAPVAKAQPDPIATVTFVRWPYT
jgi:hypothetical protein